jgi:transposase, IS6 family
LQARPAHQAELVICDEAIEQDHRRIKRLTRPMLGFQSFWTARRTLAGVEATAMLSKGQVRAVPANDISAQRAFVHRVFGVAA